MKIAFVGKGGSGKTTLSTRFAAHLAKRGKRVLAIDGDINQRFAETLGYQGVFQKTLGEELLTLKRYVKANNTSLPEAEKIAKTTPAGTGSKLLLPFSDEFLSQCTVQFQGVHLVKTGGFQEEDLGVKCYHAKTGAIELLLNHLADADDEYILVDMTAGADAFASGLFAKFDLTFVVVEPTEASISVWHQYNEYAKSFAIPLRLIANKCLDESDAVFIRERCLVEPVAIVPFSSAVRAMDRGQRNEEHLENELGPVLDLVNDEVNTIKPNRQRFQELAIQFHLKNAAAGGGLRLGSDISQHVDRSFDFEQAVKQCIAKGSTTKLD